MCKAFEELAEKRAAEMATEIATEMATEKVAEIAKKMIETGKFSVEEVATYTGLTMERVNELAD